MKHWNSKLLEQLLQVQETDLKIRGLDLQIQLYHQRSKEEDSELSRIKVDISRIDEALVNTESQNQMYATTLEDIRSAIKGLLTTKAGVPKPRTRSSTEALKIEEEKLESLVEETADQLIKLKEDRDALLLKGEARTAVLESDNEGPEAEIRKLQHQIQKLEQQRVEEVAGLPSLLLKHYDRLRSSRSGIGLTIIRDGVCTVCCMQMPTAIISKLSHGEKIDMCPACGRMVARIELPPPNASPTDGDQSIEDRPSRKLRRIKSGKPLSISRETQDERKAALKKTLKKKIAGLESARAEEGRPFARRAQLKKEALQKAAAARAVEPAEPAANTSSAASGTAALAKASGKSSKKAAKKAVAPSSQAQKPVETQAPAEEKKTSKSAARRIISKKQETKKPAENKAEAKKAAEKKTAPKKASPKKEAPKKASPKKEPKKVVAKKEPKKGKIKKAAAAKTNSGAAKSAKKAPPKNTADKKAKPDKRAPKKPVKKPEVKKTPAKKPASKKPAKPASKKK